jgi:hypothetical protein
VDGMLSLFYYYLDLLFADETCLRKVAAAVALTWITVVFLSARACYCLGVR